MASKKRLEAAKAKEKKQKVIAAVGGVILLALLAFQVPRTMKMLNAKPPEPQPATAPATTGVPTDPSVLPTPGTVDGGAAPTASGGGTLVDSDAVPIPDTGQVVTFGRFSSKDPFQQQVVAEGGGGGSTGTPKPSAPEAEGEGADPGGDGAAPAPGVQPAPDAGPQVAPGSALLAVNGTEEVVEKGGSFPKDSPVFTLVSLTKTTVRIAVAGGAFASGSPTTELQRGKALTLVNTADGTRYELKLVASGG